MKVVLYIMKDEIFSIVSYKECHFFPLKLNFYNALKIKQKKKYNVLFLCLSLNRITEGLILGV